MGKKTSKKIKSSPPKSKLNLPDDEPVKLNITFDQFIKKAANTPIKNSKIDKK
jgi:hypothetical protein